MEVLHIVLSYFKPICVSKKWEEVQKYHHLSCLHFTIQNVEDCFLVNIIWVKSIKDIHTKCNVFMLMLVTACLYAGYMFCPYL